MIADFLRAVVRHVGYIDAPAARGCEVDVIDPDTDRTITRQRSMALIVSASTGDSRTRTASA